MIVADPGGFSQPTFNGTIGGKPLRPWRKRTSFACCSKIDEVNNEAMSKITVGKGVLGQGECHWRLAPALDRDLRKCPLMHRSLPGRPPT